MDPGVPLPIDHPEKTGIPSINANHLCESVRKPPVTVKPVLLSKHDSALCSSQ
jgi:hypothetical protein